MAKVTRRHVIARRPVVILTLTPLESSLMSSLLERVLCVNGYSSDLLSDPNESIEHLERLRHLAESLMEGLESR